MFSNLKAQEFFGLHDIEWGMSLYEVMTEETSNNAHLDDDDQLVINRVNLGGGLEAKVIFGFDRDGLDEIRYIIYYPNHISKGTCKNQLSFIKKAEYASRLYNTLISNDFKCEMGWYTDQSQHLAQITGKRDDYWNCGFDKETLEIVNEFSRKAIPEKFIKRAEHARIYLKNERSKATFTINQSYTLDANELQFISCNSSYFNTLLWLVFEPNN